jgi:GcrA cell cycle regulator
MNAPWENPWTDQKIHRLRVLWDEDMSIAEIGRQLGITKNAVAGKVNRLGFPKRASPLGVRKADAKPPQPPPLARPGGANPLPAGASALPTLNPTPPPKREPELVKPLLRPPGRIVECCWPIGDPGTSAFRFCSALSEPGRQYCAEHTSRAFQRLAPHSSAERPA